MKKKNENVNESIFPPNTENIPLRESGETRKIETGGRHKACKSLFILFLEFNARLYNANIKNYYLAKGYLLLADTAFVNTNSHRWGQTHKSLIGHTEIAYTIENM